MNYGESCSVSFGCDNTVDLYCMTKKTKYHRYLMDLIVKIILHVTQVWVLAVTQQLNSAYINFFFFIQGSTLRAIQNNLNRYDDWLCVWREGMWADECSS
ncbi:hypothetical protein BpHYR1_044211 [Brachionus plicatilis]|uniref:Uncharacterized protein n=1 Tax=Brachionus plicatilis TaxID=10195 RepID=A0A3M7PST9_BRAPC|nr:hypothetical protein BpHYR1_044211 [Brachionus plicatilis]